MAHNKRRRLPNGQEICNHIIQTPVDATFGEKITKTFATTSKQLIWIFSINSILWIWCSYVLAFIGKEQIAESLSSNICTVIIGQLIVYFISKTVENIFRWNPKFGGASEYPIDQINAATVNTELEDTTGADDISVTTEAPADAGEVITE